MTNFFSQIFLDYILFLKRLAAEASIKALEEGERTLKSNHVNTVFKVSTQKVMPNRNLESHKLYNLILVSFINLSYFTECVEELQRMKVICNHQP